MSTETIFNVSLSPEDMYRCVTEPDGWSKWSSLPGCRTVRGASCIQRSKSGAPMSLLVIGDLDPGHSVICLYNLLETSKCKHVTYEAFICVRDIDCESMSIDVLRKACLSDYSISYRCLWTFTDLVSELVHCRLESF